MRNFVLYRKDVRKLSAVLLAPHVAVVSRVHKLGGYRQTIASLIYLAQEHSLNL